MENMKLSQRLEKVNEVKDILTILDSTDLPPQKRTKRKGATAEDLDQVVHKLRESIEEGV
jgi:hypothetical protein